MQDFVREKSNIFVFVQGILMAGKLVYLIVLTCLVSFGGVVDAQAQQLYIEYFTGEGDVNLVGWTGAYDASGSDGGVVGGFCWVWHKGNCGNIIYTHEYTVDTSTYSNIVFGFDLRRHSYYSTTPEVSIAVEVGGTWYVSKTVSVETTMTFQGKTLAYNPSKDNWDTLNIASLSRGTTAASNLSGNITGFGLYSNSRNVGSDCTAECDNFTITGSMTHKSADFNGDGVVDFRDYAAMADAWLTEAGSPDYNEVYDLYDDNVIDIADLAVFSQNWLLGSKYRYIPVETSREKNNFNTDWKFYKGSPSAAFEHVTMNEVGTTQGFNNWYFATSTTATGPRNALMSLFGTTWRYISTSTCYIYDGRPNTSSPPHRYRIDLSCDSNSTGPLPRLEWVSPHANNSKVAISGAVMPYCSVSGQKARILQNGSLIWESSALDAWSCQYFEVDIADLNSCDIITFMPSARAANLNFRWMYLTITESGGDSNVPAQSAFDDSAWQTINLPHSTVVDSLWPDWPTFSYKGLNWYRKHFNIDDRFIGKKIFLELEAGSVVTQIWLNGTLMTFNNSGQTTHFGAHLPIVADVTDYINFGQVPNVIAVRNDNTWDSEIPGVSEYGGLYRDIWLHITDKLHVTDAVNANMVGGGGIFVTYPFVSASQARVQVKTHVKNEYAAAKSCTVKTYIVDTNNMVVAQSSDNNNISAGSDCTFTQLITVLAPHLWHPSHPYLYTVYTEVYDGVNPVDSYKTRIGLRSVEFTTSGGFKINGETVRFRGANRCQDYPYIGFAMGNLGQRQDAKLLKEAGFEYVRAEHEPMDPAFMDACDELGIMVLACIPGSLHFGGELFAQRSYQTSRDLIRRDRNHPCVIAWELSINETWWDDPNFSQTTVNIGHAEYPGSYIGGYKDSGAWGTPAIYDISITGGPGFSVETYNGTLPVIQHEYGHWEYGGLGSTSDVHRGDGQAAMLEQATNHQHSTHVKYSYPLSKMAGAGVFCFADYLAYPSGIVDKFRLPKLSYYFWQSQRDPNVDLSYLGINSGPMVYIANCWTSASSANVKVYSNCEQVRLYINGVLAATQTPDAMENSQTIYRAPFENTGIWHPPFTFTGLTWQAGELKAEGYINGQLAATHLVRTPASAASLDIRFDLSNLKVGGDITFVYVSVLDANGTVVPNASNLISLNIVSGPATLTSPGTVSSEAGIATFLLRSTITPGLITVQATASGLTTGNASITSE